MKREWLLKTKCQNGGNDSTIEMKTNVGYLEIKNKRNKPGGLDGLRGVWYYLGVRAGFDLSAQSHACTFPI
jgi:hypothetical protein